ncbi:cytochrome b5 domain-containing protein, partial [Candidatus Parcubacteria bacterium]
NTAYINSNNANVDGSASTLADQLPLHNSSADCWLAINGKVYDVDGYIALHPGGANEIIKYCGQDATRAFSTKDKSIPQDHSQLAYSFLNDYFVGNLADVVSGGQNSNSPTNDAQPIIGSSDTTPTAPAPVSYTLTAALVAQHNTPSDCWVTANGSVYNVTSYIRAHPGGVSAITAYCGADIAAAFAAQGHSANASNIMASYKIGVLGATVDNTTVEAVNNNSVNTGGGGDDDEEEEDDD